MTVIRWLLVVPAAFAGWYAAMLTAVLVHGIAQRLCSPEFVISDQCTAPWHRPFFDALVVSGASLAAALVVLLPALMAPARRVAVARLAFIAGMAFASWAVLSGAGGKSLVAPAFIGACLSGAVTLWLFERRTAHANPRQ